MNVDHRLELRGPADDGIEIAMRDSDVSLMISACLQADARAVADASVQVLQRVLYAGRFDPAQPGHPMFPLFKYGEILCQPGVGFLFRQPKEANIEREEPLHRHPIEIRDDVI